MLDPARGPFRHSRFPRDSIPFGTTVRTTGHINASRYSACPFEPRALNLPFAIEKPDNVLADELHIDEEGQELVGADIGEALAAEWLAVHPKVPNQAHR